MTRTQPDGPLFRVKVERPCYLQRERFDPPAEVLLPLEDAQCAVASGRCSEVDRLPRLQTRPEG